MRRYDRRMRDRVVRPIRPPRRPIIYVGPRDRLYRGRRNALYAILIIFLLVFFISFLIMCFYIF